MCGDAFEQAGEAFIGVRTFAIADVVRRRLLFLPSSSILLPSDTTARHRPTTDCPSSARLPLLLYGCVDMLVTCGECRR